MDKLGWKVCWRYGGFLQSVCSSHASYRIGAVTRRPYGFGPMAMFDTLDAAKAFSRYSLGRVRRQHYPIFRCRYVESADTRLWDAFGPMLGALPPGTRFADEVKLIWEVKR